jgi:beta-carotene 3-hydroxylase
LVLHNPNLVQKQPTACRHQLTYKVAAISASLGVTSLAVLAVHYRFAWHINNGGEFPFLEAALTMLLTFGGVVRLLWE